MCPGSLDWILYYPQGVLPALALWSPPGKGNDLSASLSSSNTQLLLVGEVRKLNCSTWFPGFLITLFVRSSSLQQEDRRLINTQKEFRFWFQAVNVFNSCTGSELDADLFPFMICAPGWVGCRVLSAEGAQGCGFVHLKSCVGALLNFSSVKCSLLLLKSKESLLHVHLKKESRTWTASL